jgi:hypothetical protein
MMPVDSTIVDFSCLKSIGLAIDAGLHRADRFGGVKGAPEHSDATVAPRALDSPLRGRPDESKSSLKPRIVIMVIEAKLI